MRYLLFTFLLASSAFAQYPIPHAGWMLVPGAENLIQAGYLGSEFYIDSYADTTAPPIGTITTSSGVLTVTATPGNYFGGPLTLGPWLKTTGDFGLVATVQLGANAGGSISLTGSLATGSQYWQGNTIVDAQISANGAGALYYFDGTSPNVAAATGTAAPATAPATVTVELLRQNGQFLAYFNGTKASLADPGLFARGFVMPGIQAGPGQTLTITQFALEIPQTDTVAQLVEPVGVLPYNRTAPTPGSLAPVAGKIFSLAADINELANMGDPDGIPDTVTAARAAAQFGGFSMYETGFDQVQPAQNWYDFDSADALMATARANGRIPMFCHGDLGGGTNVTPYWVANSGLTAAQLTQLIQTHTQTVIGRYKGLCDGWTIINESLSDADGTVSKGFWEENAGASYIATALQAARAADPALKLFITDYNIENAGVKATGMYNLISNLKQQGVPIDGVGWEGHFVLNGPNPYRPNLSQMVANMAQLATLGVVVRITELDERILLPATAQNLADQASDYGVVVQACLMSPNCQGVQAFDVDDLTSWITASFPGYGAATMFDASFNPKPAYTTVMNTLQAAKPAASSIYSVHTTSGGTMIAQNTFIEIRGFNLVPGTTPAGGVVWSTAPSFAQGMMPTNLNGVSVTVNGKAAFVYFYCSVVTSPVCSLDQINVLTPLDNTTGAVQVVVTNGAVSTLPFSVTMQATAPTILLFNATGPIVATHANYALAGSGALYPGYSTPAAPGETLLVYGVGWGLPATALVNGSATQAGSLPYVPSCQVGGANASASIALIGPGLYQINLTLPATALSGNNAVSCTYNGVSTPAGTFITIQE